MPGVSSAEFRPIDRNDPTLAVDALTDFWPVDVDSDEQLLSVDSVHEWFAERPAPAPQPIPEPQPLCTVDELTAIDSGDFLDDLAGLSETHRAARDFQRFAEQFHAFATASIGGDCKCRPRR
jgi:hypothetical protein